MPFVLLTGFSAGCEIWLALGATVAGEETEALAVCGASATAAAAEAAIPWGVVEAGVVNEAVVAETELSVTVGLSFLQAASIAIIPTKAKPLIAFFIVIFFKIFDLNVFKYCSQRTLRFTELHIFYIQKYPTLRFSAYSVQNS